MELVSLIRALSDRAAYPYSAESVEVRQTHISAVFLAGEYVYKIKKPVTLSFLDFSTLENRRRFCEEEVRLNRRLAPDVYLGVVPITAGGSRVRFEGTGETIEWAVKMRRLPDEATLEQRVMRGEIDAEHIQRLAVRLAEFHAGAQRDPHISSFGRFDVVARNIRENLSVSAPSIGLAVSPAVRDRLVALTEEALSPMRSTSGRRAASRAIRTAICTSTTCTCFPNGARPPIW